MDRRERWRPGLELDFAAAQALRNVRRSSEAAGNPKFDRRLRAILLVGDEHYTQQAAAKILEVDPNSVTRWVMAYIAGGIDALRLKPISGPKPRLSDEQMGTLAKIIEKGPEEAGFDTGVWMGPMVRDLIRDRFGVSFSVEQVRRILHKAGFSLQYPKHVLSEASLAQQRSWLRIALPRIKKKSKTTRESYSSRTSASSSNRERSSAVGRSGE
jgi:transposase